MKMDNEGEGEGEGGAVSHFYRYKFLCDTSLGQIWKGSDASGRRVIIKDTFFDEMRTDKMKTICESSIEEEAIYRLLENKEIFMKLLAVKKQTFVHTMVLERAYDDMFNVLQQDQTSRGRITCSQRLVWCIQTCLLVDAMHQEGVAHLDISLENMVLRMSRKRLRFIDAGCAGVFVAGDRLNAGNFPRWDGKKPGKAVYMLPEIWRGHEYDPFAADLYSLGIVLLLLLTHGACLLYEHVDDSHFKHMQKVGGLEKYVRAMVKDYPELFPDTKILFVMLPHLERLMTNPVPAPSLSPSSSLSSSTRLSPIVADLRKLLQKF